MDNKKGENNQNQTQDNAAQADVDDLDAMLDDCTQNLDKKLNLSNQEDSKAKDEGGKGPQGEEDDEMDFSKMGLDPN